MARVGGEYHELVLHDTAGGQTIGLRGYNTPQLFPQKLWDS